MSFFERKFGKYAVKNLSLVLIILYLVGYLIYFINPNLLFYLSLNPFAIVHGQIWRLISWLLIPPGETNIFFIAVMLLFYYSIGTSLERVWGAWRYNVFIFTGILLTIISAFVWMGISYIAGVSGVLTVPGAESFFSMMSLAFSTYYINMGIFFAYAITFPDAVVLMFFIIPIKVKWLGLIDVAYLVYEFAVSNGPTRYAIAATFLNIAILYWRSRGSSRRTRAWKRSVGSGGGKPGSFGRSRSGTANTAHSDNRSSAGRKGTPMHRCAICGRTELDDPNLEFRYCTKCEGGLEYCQDHLFTHVHVRAGEVPHMKPENADRR